MPRGDVEVRRMDQPSTREARLRQRALALTGVSLVFGGVLVAVGLGWLVLVVVLVAALAGGLVLAAWGLRRHDLLQFAGRLQSEAARKRVADVVGQGGTIARRQGAVVARRAREFAEALRRARSKQAAPASRPEPEEFYGWPYAGSEPGAVTPIRVEPSRVEPSRVEPSRAEPTSEDERRRALELNARGTELRRAGRSAAAVELHLEALAVLESLDDRHAQAPTLNNLALALAATGDSDAAVERFEQSLLILRESPDDPEQGKVIANLGFTLLKQGADDRGRELLSEALGKLPPESSAAHKVEEQLRRAS